MRFGRPLPPGFDNDIAPAGRTRRLGRRLMVVLEQVGMSGEDMRDERIAALERKVAILRAQVDRIGGGSDREEIGNTEHARLAE